MVVLKSLGTDIVGVSTQGGDAAGAISGNALCGSVSGAVTCFPPVVLTLLQPRNALGFDNLDFNGFEEAVVNVAFANGDASQQFVFDLGGQPMFTPIFFGVTSNQSIASVTVYSRDPGSSDIGLRANVIDNVTVGMRDSRTGNARAATPSFSWRVILGAAGQGRRRRRIIAGRPSNMGRCDISFLAVDVRAGERLSSVFETNAA